MGNREIKFKRAHFFDEEKTRFSHFSEWGVNIGHAVFASPSTNNHAIYFIDIQYTGLKDKNGKEIYEGDIVRAEKKFYSTATAQVRWMEKRCAFYFIAKTVGRDIVNRNPYESAYKMNSLKVEVIGNIYENPELL